MPERQDGFYGVRSRDAWKVFELDGGFWWAAGVGYAIEVDAKDVGPRLDSPPG